MALSKKPYKGCRDFFPEQMRIRNFIFDKMKIQAENFAFEAYDGPLLEEVELYKAKSGEELINEQIYSFEDRGNRFVAIRPEMTPTVARMAAQVHRETPKPFRWYSIPNLMRYERPQKGRLREHWQFNADIFGSPENLAEVEITSLLIHILKSFGATEQMFSILLNDRRIVDSLFQDVLKLSDENTYKLYKVIDRSKKIKTEELEKQISEILTDETNQKVFHKYLNLKSVEELEKFLSENSLTEQAQHFTQYFAQMKELGLSRYLTYDPTIVRGLDYYTGIVFEVFDKHPDNRRAICGGGAYANLLKIFNEKPLAGVGFGLGDVTFSDFLETHKLLPDFKTAKNDLFIAYIDEHSRGNCFQLANKLRENGVKCELQLGTMKIQKMFAAAEKKGHRYIAFMGETERSKSIIQLKKLGQKESIEIDTNNINEIIKIINEA